MEQLTPQLPQQTAATEADAPTEEVRASSTVQKKLLRFTLQQIGGAALVAALALGTVGFLSWRTRVVAPPAMPITTTAAALPTTLRGADLDNQPLHAPGSGNTARWNDRKLTLAQGRQEDIAALAALHPGPIAFAAQPLQPLWSISGAGIDTVTSSGVLVGSGNSNIYVFDKTGEVQFAWPIGDSTGSLAVTRDGKVYTRTGGYLAELDIAQRTERRLSKIGGLPNGMLELQPDGSVLTAVQTPQGKGMPAAKLVDFSAEGKTLWEMNVPAGGESLTDPLGRVYLNRYDGQTNIWQMFDAAQQPAATFDFGCKSSELPAFRPDGSSYWLAQYQNQSPCALFKCDSAGHPQWSVPLNSNEATHLLALSDGAAVLQATHHVLACYEPDGRLRWQLALIRATAGVGNAAVWPGGALWLTNLSDQLGSANDGLAARTALLHVSPAGKAQLYLLPDAQYSLMDQLLLTPDYILIGGTALAWPDGLTPPAASPATQ